MIFSFRKESRSYLNEYKEAIFMSTITFDYNVIRDAIKNIWMPATYSIVFFLFYLMILKYQYDITETLPLRELSDSISDSKKIAIHMIISRSELLGSWAIAIIASLAFMLNYVRQKIQLGIFTIASTFIVFISSLGSVVFSHIAADLILRSLLVNEDPTVDPRLASVLQFQYGFLVFSLMIFVCTAIFVAFNKHFIDNEK